MEGVAGVPQAQGLDITPSSRSQRPLAQSQIFCPTCCFRQRRASILYQLTVAYWWNVSRTFSSLLHVIVSQRGVNGAAGPPERRKSLCTNGLCDAARCSCCLRRSRRRLEGFEQIWERGLAAHRTREEGGREKDAATCRLCHRLHPGPAPLQPRAGDCIVKSSRLGLVQEFGSKKNAREAWSSRKCEHYEVEVPGRGESSSRKLTIVRRGLATCRTHT